MVDILNGKLRNTIFALAWPTMIGMFLHSAFHIIDTIFVGRISAHAIAAVSMVFPVVFVMFSIAIGMGIGTTSLIARYIGAKKKKKADNAAEHSLLLALIFTIIFTTLGLAFSKQIFTLIGADAVILPLVLAYSKWIFGGSLFIFLFIGSAAILRGQGDMKTPMKYMIISTVLNIVLDPILIFGFWKIPAMGVEGAAIATIASRAIGSIMIVFALLKNRGIIQLKLRDFKYNFYFIKKIFQVGIPSSLIQVLISLGMIAIIKITSQFGAEAIAAYGIGFRLDSIAMMPVFGLASALITIVGQNVGAKQFERVKKSTLLTIGFAILIMGGIGLIFFIIPEFWIQLFNNNPKLLQYGVSYIRIVPLTYAFIGIGVIVGAMFQGMGRGNSALVLHVIRIGALMIPGAYFLAKIYGIMGIWIAIAGSSVISAIIAFTWFRMIKWKK